MTFDRFADDLIHGEETTKHNAIPAEAGRETPKYYVPEPTFIRESPSVERMEQETLFGLDLVAIGLISGMCVLGLLLIIATTCMVIVCRRTSPVTHAYYHRDANMSTAPLYNGSPLATPYKA